MQEIHDFLKKCGTYYLATTEDGQPMCGLLAPFIYLRKLYIQTGKSKKRSIEADISQSESGIVRDAWRQMDSRAGYGGGR